jgi:cytoskeletal protein CcmA (bactofilin family)
MGWFGKKKTEDALPPPGATAAPRTGLTLLGKDLAVNGKISGTDNLQILGDCEGEIDLQGNVEVRETAVMRGILKAPYIRISGTADGDIAAGSKLVLRSTAVIKGRIDTPLISVEEGAVFDGKMNMK